MPEIDVKEYIAQLRQALPYVPPIPLRALRPLHGAGDYEGMVRLIQSTMNVDIRVRIGWVNSGGPEDAPARIRMPIEMPSYGTTAFKELTLDLFIRKSFLETTSYQKAAIVVAHELAHVTLESIRHPLRGEEKAVDLTAMLLGFSGIYQVAGADDARYYSKPARQMLVETGQMVLNWILQSPKNGYTAEGTEFHRERLWQIVYLTQSELADASRMLVPFSVRAQRLILRLVLRYNRLLLLAGICLSVWLIVETFFK